jgi:RNA polymerase sigma factor (sigma-70 family)
MHRYCARMTGSALDGEDVMQEAIFEAYLKLGSFDATRPRGPWLLSIAHNRCIDFLRRRQARQVEAPPWVQPPEAVGRAVDRAIERLVIALPSKERACVLLKDVFDYSLEEFADLVESTAGGVKAALNRGRGKLATLTNVQRPERKANDEELALLRLYVDRFNRRDWQGVRELASADARSSALPTTSSARGSWRRLPSRSRKVKRRTARLRKGAGEKFSFRRISARAPFINHSEGSSRVDEDLFRKLPLRRRSLSSRTRPRRGDVQVQLHELHKSALLAHFDAGHSLSPHRRRRLPGGISMDAARTREADYRISLLQEMWDLDARTGRA